MSRPDPDPGARPWEQSRDSSHPLDIDYVRTNIPCQWACPALTNVPGYILADGQGAYGDAYVVNRRSNLLPGVLGRICSRPCEAACRHGDSDLGEPVSICALKRLAADHRSRDLAVPEHLFPPTGKTVGIVGAGPAGLAAAHSLAGFGHRVTIYEGLARPGGMLMYGIPAFRLPRNVIEEEVFNILRLGIQVVHGVRLGRDVTTSDLLRTHDAVVVATGTYSARALGVPGEDLPGVYSGLDFMMQVNQGHALKVGRRVAVLGGGFTAMDCARTSLRLGAEEVSIHIRTTEEDLTISREEVLETKREGVTFMGLVSTDAIVGEGGVATGIRFKRNRLSGARGRRARVGIPIEGSDFVFPVDTVIAAIGQMQEGGVVGSGLAVEPTFDAETGASAVPGLFAAGDFVRGASTVIESIGHARRVAVAVDEHLVGRARRGKVVQIRPAGDTARKRTWDFLPRTQMPERPVEQRRDPPDGEVELGLTKDLGQAESQRCYLCNLRYEINVPDCIFCRWCIEVCPRDCIQLVSGVEPPKDGQRGALQRTTAWNQVAAVVIDNDRCIRCGYCLRVCPTRCIHVTRTDLVEGGVPQEEASHGR